MTDAQHEAYTAYLRTLADLLGLRDWSVELMRDPHPDPDVGAFYSTVGGRKHVEITFGPDWETFSPEKKRHYATHEIMHLHLNPLDTMVCHMDGQVHRDVWSVWYSAFRTELEFSNDGIAVAVAQFMPLPPEVEP